MEDRGRCLSSLIFLPGLKGFTLSVREMSGSSPSFSRSSPIYLGRFRKIAFLSPTFKREPVTGRPMATRIGTRFGNTTSNRLLQHIPLPVFHSIYSPSYLSTRRALLRLVTLLTRRLLYPLISGIIRI